MSGNYEQRSLKLKFFEQISSPVLTGVEIKGKECESIKVALVDGVTEQVVKSGPEASAKVEIVVLEGGLDSVGADNWTSEEFEKKIVKEKSLTRPVYLFLKEGIGFVGKIRLTHTKKYRKNCEFRLGAQIVDKTDFAGVEEAKTESFVVKDGRRKYLEKRYPPSPFDEVWRLEKIAKNGPYHQRLKDANIITVKDFLNYFNKDAQGLQKILKAGDKVWEATVHHAKQCTIDKKADVHTSVISIIEHQEDEVPSYDEIALEVGSTHLSNDFSLSNSTMMESTSGDNSAISQMPHYDVHLRPSTNSLVDNDVLIHPSTSSPGTGELIFDPEVLISIDDIIECQEDEVPSDDEIDLEVGSTHLSNDFSLLNSPMMEGNSGDNFAISQMTHYDVHMQPSTNSLVDNDVLIYPSTSSPVTGGLIFDPEGLISIDDHDFGSIVDTPTSVLRQGSDPLFFDLDDDTIFRGIMKPMAQKRWTKLSRVLRWFLIFLIKKKIADLEGIHVEKKQRLS